MTFRRLKIDICLATIQPILIAMIYSKDNKLDVVEEFDNKVNVIDTRPRIASLKINKASNNGHYNEFM